MIPLQHYLILSALFFCIGLFIMITRKNNILILIGIELIFNAANINLIAFGQYNPSMDGMLFTLFVIMIAACEAAVGLAIILSMYREFKTMNSDHINELKG